VKAMPVWLIARHARTDWRPGRGPRKRCPADRPRFRLGDPAGFTVLPMTVVGRPRPPAGDRSRGKSMWRSSAAGWLLSGAVRRATAGSACTPARCPASARPVPCRPECARQRKGRPATRREVFAAPAPEVFVFAQLGVLGGERWRTSAASRFLIAVAARCAIPRVLVQLLVDARCGTVFVAGIDAHEHSLSWRSRPRRFAGAHRQPALVVDRLAEPADRAPSRVIWRTSRPGRRCRMFRFGSWRDGTPMQVWSDTYPASAGPLAGLRTGYETSAGRRETHCAEYNSSPISPSARLRLQVVDVLFFVGPRSFFQQDGAGAVFLLPAQDDAGLEAGQDVVFESRGRPGTARASVWPTLTRRCAGSSASRRATRCDL